MLVRCEYRLAALLATRAISPPRVDPARIWCVTKIYTLAFAKWAHS